MSHLIVRKVDGKNKLFNKNTKKVEKTLSKDTGEAKKEAHKIDEKEDKNKPSFFAMQAKKWHPKG